MQKFWGIVFVGVFFFMGSGHAGAAGKTIFFSYPEWVPMGYEDGVGKGRGLMVEIAREVMEKELGLTLVCRFRPWKRAQKEVEKGISDFLITVSTPSRQKYALTSDQPFYSLPLYVYTYANHEKLEQIHRIQTGRDIKALGLKPVTNLGNGWHKDNIDIHGIDTHYVDKEENILLFLANRRADIMIDAVVPTNYLIKKFELNQKIVLTKSRFSQVDFHLLLSRKSEFSGWMDRINQAFSRARQSGRIQALIAGYESLNDQ